MPNQFGSLALDIDQNSECLSELFLKAIGQLKELKQLEQFLDAPAAARLCRRYGRAPFAIVIC